MKLAILGVFYDGYEDLWVDFINLFKLNWPDCPFNLYIVNNDSHFDSLSSLPPNLVIINSGSNAEYSQKIKIALSKIDADYILVLLEDFFISKRIDNSSIFKILDFIKKNKIDNYCMPMPEFTNNKEKIRFPNSNVYRVSINKEYIYSCQPTIWKKEYLDLCIGDENYNAWIFEGIYSSNCFLRNDNYLYYSVIDYNNPLNLMHGAIQGKMVRKTVHVLNAKGYSFYTKRPLYSRMDTLIYSTKNFIIKLMTKMNLVRIKNKYRKSGIIYKYKKQIESFSRKVLDENKFKEYLDNK